MGRKTEDQQDGAVLALELAVLLLCNALSPLPWEPHHGLRRWDDELPWTSRLSRVSHAGHLHSFWRGMPLLLPLCPPNRLWRRNDELPWPCRLHGMQIIRFLCS